MNLFVVTKLNCFSPDALLTKIWWKSINEYHRYCKRHHRQSETDTQTDDEHASTTT